MAELMGDAFEDLAGHLERARDAVPRAAGDLQRFTAVLRGLRGWSLADPQRFAIAFGPRAAGYVEPADAPAIDSAKRSMAVLASTLTSRATADPAAPPGIDAGEYARTYEGMLQAWIAVHGFVSLEVFGHLAWMPDAECEALFESQLRMVASVVCLA
jgi:hypothetical protein